MKVSPSLRYSQLKNKIDDSFYFSGFIARSVINYQFNNTLSFQIIGEFNNFNKSFFYQPLLKWNPNLFTIFILEEPMGIQKSNQKIGMGLKTVNFILNSNINSIYNLL